MTKQEWLKHRDETGPHDQKTCASCQARVKTWKAGKARRDRESAYKSCGLVKVRGALGGTYWE